MKHSPIRSVQAAAASKPRACSLLATAGLAVLLATPAAALTVDVLSLDSVGEGFGDQSPVAPIGGNPGTTLGAQRMFVFKYAADAFGARLTGTVPVTIGASFDTLFGNATSATLGSASPTTVHLSQSQAPIPGVPKHDTWYAAGLFSQFRGFDVNDTIQNPNRPEVSAQFNSAVDNQVVLGNIDFYYGLDGNNGTDVDFLSVALHEIAHGLGFLDLMDPSTGELFQGLDDAYTNFLEDPTNVPKNLADMSNAQRAAALVHSGNLLWNGPSVMGNSAYLTQGRLPNGRVQMFAPNPYQPGSSVAHFDTSLLPNELMEPFATTGIRDMRLTINLFKDLGWGTIAIPKCGDPNNDSAVTTADALHTLRAATGAVNCQKLICDVNLSGAITTADALATLKAAVGIVIKLNCPLS